MTSSARPQFVVGIGSAASGLEALEGLVGALEPGGHSAYVVAEHPAPGHPSLLAELLAHGTRLTVVPATDGLLLEPDTIAIVPPGREVRVDGDRLRLGDVESTTGSHPSIDLLLESIAESWDDHAVGVILSGTGSDGASGMRRVKAGGGLTIVQSPQSATFEAMPPATLPLGVGDLALEPAEIGARLSRLGTDGLDRVRGTAQAALDDFTRVTDALPEVVWQRDASFTRLLYVSKRIEDLTGISVTELGEDASVLDACIHEADRERVWASRTTVGPGWTVDYRIRARDGGERWVAERGSVVCGVGGVDRVVGTLTDVTEQVETIRREAQQKQVFEAVFRAPFFGVAILDADSRVIIANEAFCDLLGYDTASILRMPFAAFGCPAGDAPLASSSASHHLVRRDGSSCWANVDMRRLPQPLGDAAIMVILRDVTRWHEQQEELARQTAIDASTGLLNRMHFQRSLEREIDQCQQTGTPLALVWIDSDRFKEVNDQYGHAVGDAILRATAEGLASAVRPTDIVGRVGGDEFGVMLNGYADANDREAAVDRMLWAIRQPTPAGETGVVMTASIGVAVYPEDGDTADALMQAADTAMHAAKRRGGNTFEYFREEMTRAADERRRRRAEIDRAIAGQEFEMHYQPIIDVRSGRLWGVEALVRWNREGRVVAAGEFIDFCEASGQIRALAPLTLSLFRTDLELLRAAGADVGRACVNLSPSQLEDRAFTDLMGWWPPPSGLQGVVVEVTEAAFLPRQGRAIEALELLAGLGAELSVDDFGSGYSNFSLLKSLSPSFIKLDRSFLADLQAGGRGGQLLAAAIQMAHALNSSVIAEGIESEEQLAAVSELGADLVQGDFIAEPMPRDVLVSWIWDRQSEGSVET